MNPIAWLTIQINATAAVFVIFALVVAGIVPELFGFIIFGISLLGAFAGIKYSLAIKHERNDNGISKI